MFENGKEAVAYLVDIDEKIPSTAVAGNFAVFGANRNLVDSDVKPSDFITPAGVDGKVSAASNALAQMIINADALAAYSANTWAATTDYLVGSYCQYGGAGYKCTTTHTSGSAFDPTQWQLVLTADGREAINSLLQNRSSAGLASLSDLAPNYNASTSVHYSVGQLVNDNGVLKICTQAGNGYHARFSDDATVDQAIAQRLAQAVLSEKVPYQIVTLVQEASDATRARFTLEDRAINRIVSSSVPHNVEIDLALPSAVDSEDGTAFARDFYVALDVSSDEDIPVNLLNASLRNSAGQTVTLKAPNGELGIYHFTEISGTGNVFLVTGLADPAYLAVKEIERALDEILEGSAVMPDIHAGIYIEKESDPNTLYKLVAWEDPETGEVVTRVLQNPVERL